jgi:hypothetical protein
VFVNSGLPIISNCIVWKNVGSEISDQTGVLTVHFSNINGGFDGQGKIDSDPLFADSGAGFFGLAHGSPCIDAADNGAVPAGIATDLAGNLRFVDGPSTKDTGAGIPPIVDMGALEFPVPVVVRLIER